jgi:hypothetical protein
MRCRRRQRIPDGLGLRWESAEQAKRAFQALSLIYKIRGDCPKYHHIGTGNSLA